MKINSILFILMLALTFTGCGDDDSDTNSSNEAGEAGAAEGGSAGEAAGSEAPAMGPGCYSGPPSHMCDCSIAEDECAAPQIWTDMCPCGSGESDAHMSGQEMNSDDGDGSAGNEQSGEAGSMGNACYSPATHECDCDTTEMACSESGGLWTDMCPCDGSGEGDGHMDDDEMNGGDGSGCYGGPPEHSCECGSTEDACSESGGIWTDMCEC